MARAGETLYHRWPRRESERCAGGFIAPRLSEEDFHEKLENEFSASAALEGIVRCFCSVAAVHIACENAVDAGARERLTCVADELSQHRASRPFSFVHPGVADR